MRIIGWTHYDDPTREELFPIGDEVSWEQVKEVEDAIVEELRSKGYKFSGYYHQNGDYGCPVFENGKWYGVSFRRWGSIMAEAYPEYARHYSTHGYVMWAWVLRKNRSFQIRAITVSDKNDVSLEHKEEAR